MLQSDQAIVCIFAWPWRHEKLHPAPTSLTQRHVRHQPHLQPCAARSPSLSVSWRILDNISKIQIPLPKQSHLCLSARAQFGWAATRLFIGTAVQLGSASLMHNCVISSIKEILLQTAIFILRDSSPGQRYACHSPPKRTDIWGMGRALTTSGTRCLQGSESNFRETLAQRILATKYASLRLIGRTKHRLSASLSSFDRLEAR